MKVFLTVLASLRRDESGLEMVEYAVMTALIVGTIVTALGLLAGAISARMDATTAVLNG